MLGTIHTDTSLIYKTMKTDNNKTYTAGTKCGGVIEDGGIHHQVLFVR